MRVKDLVNLMNVDETCCCSCDAQDRQASNSCKKQVLANVPGVAPYACRGTDVGAVLNFLNMSGLSRTRSAEFVCDTLTIPVPRKSAYRNKISKTRQAASKRDVAR